MSSPTNNAYTQNAGLSSIPYIIIENRDPTSSDVQGQGGYFKISQFWMNQSTKVLWQLFGFTSPGGVLTADWDSIGGDSGQVNTLTGDDAIVINPDVSGNINILGNVVANATHAKALFTENSTASTMRVDLQLASAIVSTDVTKVGLSAFNSEDFSVDSNGFVTLVGGTTTESFMVDANTGPGTNPVVPNASGIVTITGNQIAAGTTANVIRTDSLAANTFTIEIQRSQAVASSTVGDNGVCHFNNTQFTVDSNGFVSIAADTGIVWSNISANQTLVVGHGYFCSSGAALSLALPATSNVGDTIKIALNGSTSWSISQASGQQIRVSNQTTTLGATGSLASTQQGDCVEIVCMTANTIWVATNFTGGLSVT